jgi:CheY-like chemotaxis protein
MSKKILIVEDDALLYQLYQEMFKEMPDLTTLNATNGQDALKMVISERPDLIILDVMLPGGMNGFDILEKVEADPLMKAIPVIMLTNLDTEQNVADAIGAKKYLVKVNTTKEKLLETVLPYLQ